MSSQRDGVDHRPAWRSRAAVVTAVVTLAIGLTADLLTKELAFARVAGGPVRIDRADVLTTDRLSSLIPAHEPVTVAPGLLDLTLVLNPGAVFGLGAGKRWLFVIFTLAALSFAAWMFASWTGPRDRAAHLGVGLLAAGGLGNLYDRLVFACVRDFLHPLPGLQLPWGITWPNGSDEVWPYVSNVADLWLIIGIVLLVAHGWFGGREAEVEAGSEDAEHVEG